MVLVTQKTPDLDEDFVYALLIRFTDEGRLPTLGRHTLHSVHHSANSNDTYFMDVLQIFLY